MARASRYSWLRRQQLLLLRIFQRLVYRCSVYRQPVYPLPAFQKLLYQPRIYPRRLYQWYRGFFSSGFITCRLFSVTESGNCSRS